VRNVHVFCCEILLLFFNLQEMNFSANPDENTHNWNRE
jgi:hypothetical protein